MGPDRLARQAPGAVATRSRGIGVAVLGAAMFSVATVMARLALEDGMDVSTANAARFLFAVLVLVVFFVAQRRFPSLLGRQRLAAAALGVAFFLTGFCFLGAIEYIPVSIAVLVLYTYPLLVGLIAWAGEREALWPVRLASLGLAFCGLALALDVRAAAPPDWRGLALACLAAASMSAMVVGSGRVMRNADRGTVNLHILVTAATLFVIVLALTDGPHWPRTGGGWMAVAGLVVSFAVAQLALIAAIGWAGPVLAATIMNLEPLITIALAVFLVGERLTLLQALGAALVIIAIFLVSRANKPAAASADET